jgi:plastocyanin
MPSRYRARCDREMSGRFAFCHRVQRCVLRAALISALLLCGASTGFGDEKPVVHSVLIEGTSFNTQSLTVRRGDSIVWKNNDPFPHTVTARKLQFDSHILAAGRSWKYTAKERGEFPYFCMLHQTMTGMLIVK